jgi:molybdate transport system substrate-binding protein
MLCKAVTITRGQTGDGMRNVGRTILSRSRHLATVALLLTTGACAGVQEPVPESTPLRLLSSNGVRAAIEAVQPQMEMATGLPLSAEFSTAAALKRKIDAGEPFDVAILTPALVDDLVAQGRAVAESRSDLARVGVGVGAREGAPRSDVSTPDALKRTLLDAKVVAYTAEGQSRATVNKALAQLGITAEVDAKSMLTGPGEGPGAVAAGKADLVMTLISEILIPGVQLLGPFPPEMQNYVVFTAVRSPNAKNVEGANTLLRYLTGPEVADAMKTHALEPIRSR